MKVHPEELGCWSALRPLLDAPSPTPEQLGSIDVEARRLLRQTMVHKGLHNLASVVLVTWLLVLDALAFTWQGTGSLALMAIAHGLLLYSLTIYTMHEGAGHRRLILGGSPALKPLAFLLNNASRLFFADPVHYEKLHPSHHRHLGTPADRAFTQLVKPSRIGKSFLPGAGLLSFNDYKIHAGDAWTASKMLSLLVGLVWSAALFLIASPQHDPWLLVLILLVGAPWIGFSLDRLRESSEHLLMKADGLPEARELGNGFWGYLVGGGPWGQPCHLSHHIAPALPWYQQLRLSRHIKRTLTFEQGQHFFVPAGLLGYPRVFVRLIRENERIFREQPPGSVHWRTSRPPATSSCGTYPARMTGKS